MENFFVLNKAKRVYNTSINIEYMPFSPEDYTKVLDNSLETATQTCKEIDEKILNLQIDNTNQRREYNKHITTISIAILGLTPLMADKVNIHGYYLFAIAILVFEILFLILKLREDLDYDNNNLLKMSREGNPFREAVDMSRKYILMDKTEENSGKFIAEVKVLQDKAQTNLNQSNQNDKLDYTLEFIIFLFVVAVLLLLLSILLKNSLKGWQLVGIIIIVFYGSFFTSSLKIIKPINSILNYFVKK